MDYISLGINIDKETEGLTPKQREEFKRMLYTLHVNGKVKFTPSTNNVLRSNWKIREQVRAIVDGNCEEIPYEGTEVNRTHIPKS